jgi:hypothetical protein
MHDSRGYLYILYLVSCIFYLFRAYSMVYHENIIPYNIYLLLSHILKQVSQRDFFLTESI